MTPAPGAGPAQGLPAVFMFSGQGSQYHQMGRELYDSDEVFRETLRGYDTVVAEELGESVLDRVFDPARARNEPFTDTRFTNPAIVMLELALAQTLRASGTEPVHLLGCSLGEYAAAVVAGSLDAADCLRLLVRQADALRSGPRGGMLAVLAGLEVLDRAPALRDCDIAARNYPGHFVVAGTETDLVRAETELLAANVPHQRIPVEYAFHSRLMDRIQDAAAAVFVGVRMVPPRLSWLSCVDGRPVERPDADHFWRVARHPIDFERTVAALRARGDFLYLDLGPSGTLHNFVRNSLPAGTRSRSLALLTPFGHSPDPLAGARALAAPPLARTTAATPMAHRRAPVMKVYGFPGQGSQRRGMGKGLFERFPEHAATADRVLGYSLGELCATDPQRRLARTDFTQPALYVVSALTYLDRLERDPAPADFLVGHSLGEYVALFAAGVFDFETGLRIVQRRGELMAAASGGAMAAVVGVDEPTVTRLLADSGLGAVDVANHNAPDQVVLSGPADAIDTACGAFEAAGARAVRLNVSAPFHSRYMRGAAEEFARFLDGFTLRPPTVPVLANADAQPYRPDAVKETLTAQIASPVRWTDTVRRLMGQGDFEFIELGPGQVLTKLVTRIRDHATPLPPTSLREPAHHAPPTRPHPVPAGTPAPAPASAPVPVSGPVPASGPVPIAVPVSSPTPAPIAEPAATSARPPSATPAPADSSAPVLTRPAPEPAAAPLPEPSVLSERRAFPAPDAPGHALTPSAVEADGLGARSFRERYGLRRSYLLGSLYGGISGPQMLRAAQKAGLLGFLGTGGLPVAEVETMLRDLGPGGGYGANLLYRHGAPDQEDALVDALMRHGADLVEASGFPLVTPALVRFRLKGGRILAKVSRTDVAAEFLAPPPPRLVARLLAEGRVSEEEAAAAASRPMADDLCVEAEGGWLSGAADLLTLLPAVLRLRDAHALPGPRVHVGCAGGIGTPEAAAAAFLLGAEFVLTGSVNQCTVEAATSAEVKELLVRAREYDVDSAPWGEMFELGVRARYLKRGLFFPTRAARLHELWRRHASLDELDEAARSQILDSFLGGEAPATPAGADAKARLASVLRGYFDRGFRLAVTGDPRSRVDYLVHCGPAMGAFNQVVAGTDLQPWQARTVEAVADTLMEGAASHIVTRLNAFR